MGFARHGISLSEAIREVEFLASCFLQRRQRCQQLVWIPLELAGEIAQGPGSSPVATLHLEYPL